MLLDFGLAGTDGRIAPALHEKNIISNTDEVPPSVEYQAGVAPIINKSQLRWAIRPISLRIGI